MEANSFVGIAPGIFSVLGRAWNAIATMDGRTGFFVGFFTCFVIWRLASISAHLVLRFAVILFMSGLGLSGMTLVGHFLGQGSSVPAQAATVVGNAVSEIPSTLGSIGQDISR